ncbi:Metallo-dependent phosphatase [Aulographum hederae CBS 113979]|uniref:Metallo-dependent phosphatase n=1 Tax=Aulographum hederae CBS 113979 TaxID=1176131 RepID=A0A6G1GXE7_9PEZI|nr:Metallo-dependent phosphatase [Aulographum hederae CBS 113979]
MALPLPPILSTLILLISTALFIFPSLIVACDSCTSPSNTNEIVHTRLIKRIQPDALGSPIAPSRPLEWGQVNFLHTTDTHGWLEGHIKERNYGGDWGDYVSFVRTMRGLAEERGVDLLVVDCGDLHDGAGLSDATTPNGLVSLPLFEEIDYDLLAIGNHELYVAAISYEHFYNFSRIYGDRYVTSNVEIMNPATGNFEYIGSKYRYFTTKMGLRIMAFGVLFNFGGNSNSTRITFAQDFVKQQWFLDAVNLPEPIDMFVLVGHNPVAPNETSSSWQTVHNTIRALRPNTPIQYFGGHNHIRDLKAYDNKATALGSGRYCETLGWLSIDGVPSPSYGPIQNTSYPRPTALAVPGPLSANFTKSNTSSSLRYSRRYLDWNRLTFAFHAAGSQDANLDTHNGLVTTGAITALRQQLNLTSVYGCAPRTYCVSCAPFGSEGNIFTLLNTAYATVVVNESRADVPRIIVSNGGNVRFDLVQGPFTYDDSFIVSPFTNTFRFLPNVPFEFANQVTPILDAGPHLRRRKRRSLSAPKSHQKRDLSTSDFGFSPLTLQEAQATNQCLDPPHPPLSHHVNSDLDTRSPKPNPKPPARITRRQLIARQDTSPDILPGYTTTDDLGTDGDDTPHSRIPSFPVPNAFSVNSSFPEAGAPLPETVDLVWVDFLEEVVLEALMEAGMEGVAEAGVGYYLEEDFTSNLVLREYAMREWKVPEGESCRVGEGIGG